MQGIISILMIIAVIIGILWIFMPFLIMGTNKRLDKLIKLREKEQSIDPEKTNYSKQLDDIYQQLNTIRQYHKMNSEKQQ